MRVTLAVFQLDKLGGKERDSLAVARFLAARGHAVTVLTSSAPAAPEQQVQVLVLPIKGASNHARTTSFAAAVRAHHAAAAGDALLAFDRVPGADVFFAADPSYTLRYSGLTSWLLPRRRAMLALERGLFDVTAKSHIFFLTARQRDEYRAAYRLDPARATILPLILHEERYVAVAARDDKAEIRARLGLAGDAVVALCIGIPAKRKGFDRALEALAAHPKLQLILAGSSDRWIEPRVAQLGLQDRVRVLPYGADVVDLLSAADVFLHPAREEAAGVVLGEALLAGTPVIVSGVCGYAPEIARCRAGIVLPEPFETAALVRAIGEVLGQLPAFRQAAEAESARLQQVRGDWLTTIADKVEAQAPRAG
ncbi:glycosyltransferase family 4 protein [Rhodopseudomonas palustris]|uniref:Glycosyl transferase, group 1 n=1 Tax=Rhodopseudomonas palustris (strain BisB18) TaxID=316056 RepID=Q219N2_RHOPB